MGFINRLFKKDKLDDPVYEGKPISQWTSDLKGDHHDKAENILIKAGRVAVPHLIKALKYNSPLAQLCAVHALGKIKDPQAVEPLCAILKIKKTWDIRMVAPEALGEIGDARAVEPLIDSLKQSITLPSEDYSFQLNFFARVSKALQQIGEPAVDPLIAALKNVGLNKEFEDDLLSILNGYMGKLAVKSLIEALKDESWRLRWNAAFVLGSIGDDRGVEPLISALKDPYLAVREHVAWALGKIGDDRGVEPLISALKDDYSNVRKQVAWALKEITEENFGEDLEKWQRWWEQNKEIFLKRR